VLFEMWQTVGDPVPALPMLMERILRTHQLRNAGDKGEALPRQQRSRTILPIEFDQLRLIFEQLQLAWGTRHVQVDHSLRARGELWRQRGQRALPIAL